MNKQSESFIYMAAFALAGAALGLIAGLLLGMIIQAVTGALLSDTLLMDDGPWVVAPFLGMGFGTLVGAVLGGLSGLKR